jgi:peptidyl-tRNA hydrolase
MTDSRCYIILNKELQMPVGKLAVQVGHAMDQVWDCYSSMCYENFTHMKLMADFHTWKHDGRKKVLLRAKNDLDVQKLKDKLLDAQYVVLDIVDNGVNFFDGKTRTGIIVFPVLKEVPELKRVQVYK